MKFAALLSSCLIAALPLTGYPVKAQSPVETLRVGIYQNKPKVFLDEAGNPQGFWIDLLEYIADAEDWLLEYVPCQWDRCLQAVEQGQLDLMMDVAFSEERDRLFDFNQEVVLTSWSVVYARSGLKLDSVLDLDQKRVAVLKKSIQYAALINRTKNFGIKPQFVEVVDFQEMFRLLDQGHVDAGVVNHFFGQEIESQYEVEKTHILITPDRLHFIFPQGQHSDLRAAIDRQLRKLIANSNSAYYQALEHWLEPEGQLGWVQIKHILLDLTVYVPIVGLIVVLVWNRFLNQEVTLRKRTEARLQESEERYRSIYEQAAVGLANVTLDGKFLKLNPRFCEMLGYSQEELLAKTVLEITHPDDRTQISPAMKRLLAGKVSSFFQEKRYLRQDGSCFWSSTSVSLVRDGSGNPKYYLAVILDISDRKQAEAALRESEARWQFALEGSGDGVWDWNTQTNKVFFSRQWKAMLGYTESEVGKTIPGCTESEVGKTLDEWDSCIHPDDRDHCYADLEKHFSGETPFYQNEHRVRCQDGSYKWILDRGKVIQWTADGQPLRVIGTHTDISDRKQAEGQLIASENKFRSIFNHAAVGIIYGSLKGGHGTLQACNPCFCQMLGYTAAELTQLTVAAITHPDDRAIPNLSRLIAGEIPHFSMEKRYLRKDGTVMWGYSTVSILRDDAGKPLNTVVVVEDISDRKKAEAALQESESRYRKVVEAQSDFILRSLPDTTITFANKTLCSALGISLEEILGKKWIDFANPDDRQERVFNGLAKLNPKNPRFVVENQDKRADGQPLRVIGTHLGETTRKDRAQ